MGVFEPSDDGLSGWETRDYGDLVEVAEALRRLIEPEGTRGLRVIAFSMGTPRSTSASYWADGGDRRISRGRPAIGLGKRRALLGRVQRRSLNFAG